MGPGIRTRGRMSVMESSTGERWHAVESRGRLDTHEATAGFGDYTELKPIPSRCSSSRRRRTRRAQRLSASRPGEPARCWKSLASFPCSTPFGITARGTTQWEKEIRKATKCSTPFDITARGTHALDVHRVDGPGVLNAFRDRKS